MTLETVSFEGHECVRLEGGEAALVLTVSAGPRILGMVTGDENLFAVLPDAGLNAPDGRRFRFLGGHRLWAAPEVPPITYQPDDRPCTVSEIEDGLGVEAPPDGAHVVKAIWVRRTSGGWIVDHVLRNASRRTMTISPWAITQLRTGGEAVVAIPPREEGPLADRSLVLWPYTDPGDPRLRFGRDEVHLDAGRSGPPMKIGAAPSGGSVAYRYGGHVFEKRIDLDPHAPYPDRGAAVQVYLCDEFCELETLGPLRELEPGGSATHRERWTLGRAD